MNLCSRCQEIGLPDRIAQRSGSGGNKIWYKHHALEVLAHSAQEGCHLCTIILRAIRPAQMGLRVDHFTPREIARHSKESRYFIWGKEGLYNVEFTFPVSSPLDVTHCASQFKTTVVLAQHPIPVAATQTGDEKGLDDDTVEMEHESLIKRGNSGSEESLKFALDNLKTCLNDHELCKYSFSEDKELPTRLIDLNELDAESRLYVRRTHAALASTP